MMKTMPETGGKVVCWSRGIINTRRDMLVNPRVKDIPVLVIQYMGLFGRRMLQVHVDDEGQDRRRTLCVLGKGWRSSPAPPCRKRRWSGIPPCSAPAASPSPARAVSWSSWPGTAVSYLAAAAQVRQTGAVRAGICGCGSS